MQKKHLILALIIYVISAVGSYTAFSSFYGGQNVEIQEGAELNDEEDTGLGLLLQIDPNAPKDQPCPLSGEKFTQVEREAWEQRRPLFVMIENTPEARPQSGLSKADVVFEAVAEGGVTRFGAMYYCAAQRQEVVLAPIRSARSYFVDWASGFYRPLYVHVGGANVPGPTDALGQISQYDWSMQNDINQFSVDYPTFVRNYDRLDGKQLATEHTMESSTEKLWAVGEDRGWTATDPEGNNWLDLYEGWTFETETPEPGTITTVSHPFWSGYDQYSVKWEYDPSQDRFLRFTGGEPHTDLNNGKQIAAANVIVLKTTEKGPINEKKHMIYGTTGTGNALIFKHGDVVEATWSKPTRTSELQFTDALGQPVELARGPVWISVVGLGTEVTY
jgi:hypothetical protein